MDKQGYKYAVPFNLRTEFNEFQPCKVVEAVSLLGHITKVVLTDQDQGYFTLTDVELATLTPIGGAKPLHTDKPTDEQITKAIEER